MNNLLLIAIPAQILTKFKYPNLIPKLPRCRKNLKVLIRCIWKIPVRDIKWFSNYCYCYFELELRTERTVLSNLNCTMVQNSNLWNLPRFPRSFLISNVSPYDWSTLFICVLAIAVFIILTANMFIALAVNIFIILAASMFSFWGASVFIVLAAYCIWNFDVLRDLSHDSSWMERISYSKKSGAA